MTGAHIEHWSGRQFAARVDDAMRIYVRAMKYPEHTGAQRAVSARKHVSLDGFACRAALLDDGTLVGFGYGYTTKPGQWWHDLVRNAVNDQTAHEWLADAFELSELHVLPEYHGIGIGRRLLVSLASGIPHSAVLLSTPDAGHPRVPAVPRHRLRRPGPQLPLPGRRPAVRGARRAAAVARWPLTP